MDREKLILTREEGVDIIDGDSNEYTVISDKITSKSRWSDVHTVVIQRLSDNKFFKDHYRHGSTESQEERAWDYSKPNFTEVFPKEKTITVYE